jgi:hypothetical protein
MASSIISKIDNSLTFRFDKKQKRDVNLGICPAVEIDEFLDIQHILDLNRIRYRFLKNFEIEIVA